MTDYDEINSLPKQYKPLSAWNYFWLTILYSLSIVGFVFLIIHALSNKNINRRNFARSYFCIIVILLVIFGIVALTGGLSAIFSGLTQK